MAPSALMEKSQVPQDGDVERVLGRAGGLWNRLKASLSAQFEPLAETWKFSGAKYGWSLQLQYKKRTVVYLIPNEGQFTAAFAFGEKAVAAAHASDLPANILDLIDNAKEYPEGRAVRMEVKAKKDVGIVEKLAGIKMGN
jgi:hypothetical protein